MQSGQMQQHSDIRKNIILVFKWLFNWWLLWPCVIRLNVFAKMRWGCSLLPAQPAAAAADDDSPDSYDKYAAYVISNRPAFYSSTHFLLNSIIEYLMKNGWKWTNKSSLVSSPCADVVMRFQSNRHEQPFMATWNMDYNWKLIYEFYEAANIFLCPLN